MGSEMCIRDRVTPRSGGLAIIGGWWLAMIIVASFVGAAQAASDILTISALGGLALAIGYADDRYSMTSLFKFAGQIAVAAIFVWFLGDLQTAPVPFGGHTALGISGIILTLVWIVGFMNVFNFMDGSNGLAAIAAMIVLCVLAIACAAFGAPLVAFASLALAFAIAGFSRVNFPSGRIFMGDNGSQSVSFLIAALAVMAANRTDGAISFLFVPTAMMPFIFDVGFTLAHRIARRKNIVTAHREHLYQLLMRHGASHIRVAGIYFVLIAFSTTAAVLMLRLPSGLQWIAPVFLSAVFWCQHLSFTGIACERVFSVLLAMLIVLAIWEASIHRH